MWQRLAPIVPVFCLFLAGCMAGNQAPVTNVVPASTVDYEHRVRTYAETLNTELFGPNTNQNTYIVPAIAQYQPGTILVGADVVDRCAIPDDALLKNDVSWIPAQGSSSEYDFSYTPGTVLKLLSDAHLKISAGSAVSLDFQNMAETNAMLSPFREALRAAGCAGKIAAAGASGQTVTVIRGRIDGMETFSFSSNPSVDAGAGTQNVGTFSITLAPDKRSLSLKETQPTTHFLITYNIPPPAAMVQARVAPAAETGRALLHPQ